MACSRTTSEDGFTLVEVIVASAILLVGVLGALSMLNVANGATSQTQAREAATNLAREAIEATRAVPYPNMTPAQLQAELIAQPGLGDSSPSTPAWTVVRRNVTFTMTARVCSVDDGTVPSDGFGDHTGGSFCPESVSTGTLDLNPDDYKRVSVTATWARAGRTYTATQEAVMNNPGSAFAPAIKTLVASPVSPLTSGPGPGISQVIGFTATTSARPHDVRWALDGVDQRSAMLVTSDATHKTWAFSWNVGNLVDGTYRVSVEAFDQYGQAGPGRTYNMVLNRYAPLPPTGLIGGRNALWGTEFAEFEWSPNPERDVIGYRVYRVVGDTPSSSDVVVCTTAVADAKPLTSCADESAPAAGEQHYYVVALATPRSGSLPEESPRPSLAATLTVKAVNSRPSAPEQVTVSPDADGVRLSWLPSTDDGSIRMYRVYRDDNTSAAVRYDRSADGLATTFIDAAGATAPHRYWVTAVDDELAESEFGPADGVTSP